MNIVVNPLALERYREKFDGQATRDVVAAMVADAEPAPAWIRKFGEAMGSHVPGRRHVVAGECVFVVALEGDRTRVITVLSMDWFRSMKRKGAKPAAHGRRGGRSV